MECTVFIVDFKEIGDEWEKPFVYMEHVMLCKVQAQRKTDYVGAVYVHSNTNNTGLAGVWSSGMPRAPVTLKDTREWLTILYEECRGYSGSGDDDDGSSSSSSSSSSAFDALLYSAVELAKFIGSRKGKPKVVLMTCNEPTANVNEITVFREQFVGELVVAGPQNVAGRLKKWQPLADHVHTFDELIQGITDPKPRLIRPVRVWQGDLRLGADEISLQVDGYPATKSSSTIHRKVMAKYKDNYQECAIYREVKAITEYTLFEEENEIAVSKDHVTRAYRYGSHYVDLPYSLDQEREWKESVHIDIRGFIPLDHLPRHLLMGESMYLVPTSKSPRANHVAFFALVDSLINSKRLVLARMVSKAGNSVQMCCMTPLRMLDRRRNEIRVLVTCRLPLSEDERVSSFPRILGGKPIAADAAMGRLVDSMNLDNIPSNQMWYESDNVTKYTDAIAFQQQESLKAQNSILNSTDPLSIPAIAQHRLQQVVLECAHQRYIMQRSCNGHLTIPPLSECIEKKITPRYAPEEVAREVAQVLPVAKRLKPEARDTGKNLLNSSIQVKVKDDDNNNTLDLESLLALGEKK